MANLIIDARSHLDHGLTEEHIAFLREVLASYPVQFVGEVFDLPGRLRSLPSALYGPEAGDPPILDSQAHLQVRGGRMAPSRLIRAPFRPVRSVVVVAIPEGDHLVLATAYGGLVLAPREPSDAARVSPEVLAESEAFWAQHALATGEYEKTEVHGAIYYALPLRSKILSRPGEPFKGLEDWEVQPLWEGVLVWGQKGSPFHTTAAHASYDTATGRLYTDGIQFTVGVAQRQPRNWERWKAAQDLWADGVQDVPRIEKDWSLPEGAQEGMSPSTARRTAGQWLTEVTWQVELHGVDGSEDHPMDIPPEVRWTPRIPTGTELHGVVGSRRQGSTWRWDVSKDPGNLALMGMPRSGDPTVPTLQGGWHSPPGELILSVLAREGEHAIVGHIRDLQAQAAEKARQAKLKAREERHARLWEILKREG